MKFKVLLLGATGRTGKLILAQLLQRGYDVSVIVRNPSKIHLSSPYLNIFEGSTLNTELLTTASEGCQAVISALNISRTNDFPWSPLRTPKTLMSDTVNQLLPVLEKRNIKRVIVLSAWGANETRKDMPWWFSWLIKHSNINYGYLDHERQEHILAQTQLYWTAIRPVGLINSKRDKPVKVSLGNNSKPSLIISRESVAKFAVDILEQAEFIALSPAVFW